MKSSVNYQALADAYVARCWIAIRKVFPGVPVTPPAVRVNNRFKTTGGMAYLYEYRIEIAGWGMREHGSEFMDFVLPHELAHIVAYLEYNEEGHGPDWKHVMRCIGQDPVRCHPFINTAHETAKAKK